MGVTSREQVMLAISLATVFAPQTEDSPVLNLNSDFEGRYQHEVTVDMPLPKGLFAPSRALVSVAQRDSLNEASWSNSYDILPLWPYILARITGGVHGDWHIHFEEWGSAKGEIVDPIVRTTVDDCLKLPHVVAELEITYTVIDDGDGDSHVVQVQITIDKDTGEQLEAWVLNAPDL